MDTGLFVFEAETMGFLAVSWVVGVVLHEAGHAVVAWSTGLQPRMVSVGTGRALVRLRVGAVWLVWRLWPLSGFVRMLAPGAGQRVARMAVTAAGPLANLVLLAPGVAAYWSLPDDFAIDRPEAFMALVCWMVAQGFIFLMAMRPAHGRIAGGRAPTDGLKLLLLMTKPEQGTLPTVHAALLRPFVPVGSSLPPVSADSQEIAYEVTRLDRFWDPWAGREAAAGMRRVLERGRVEGVERALVLDFLVGSELLYGPTGVGGTALDGTMLDAWSSEAMGLAPCPATRVMRGGVLVALGRFEEGRAWLFGALKTGTSGFLPAMGRVFLAQAAAGVGDVAGARQWMGFARAKLPKAQALALLPLLARLEKKLEGTAARA